ncbi:Transcriptional regulator, LysR family [hydrothermal vent metagenome]|uniref:Transcriptional regulator, LysR family n=1 Tax=hydrothermal vent metagenome TaxID=652676 RepID=A0A3B0T0X2_9ZZZZ
MNINGFGELLEISKTGSFTAAAGNLGVSVAHVSRRIAALEARIGARLLIRSTRSVRLSDRGAQLMGYCERIQDFVDEAFEVIGTATTRIEGRLRIASLSGSVADKVVTPAMVEFARAYPEIEIEADFNPRAVDLRREGYDFAIRAGHLDDSDLIAKPLMNRHFIAAASPSYLSGQGIPQTPDDLKHHECILTHGKSWSFRNGDKTKSQAVSGRFKSNSGAAVLNACEAGLGIAYMASTGFGDQFETGALVPVLSRFWRTEKSVYMIYEDKRFLPERVRLAMAAIERQAKPVEQREVERLLKLADLSQ